MSTVEKTYINAAMRMYKNLRPTEYQNINSIAEIVFRDGLLYEEQFRTLFRAVLFYRLNFPEDLIYKNSEQVMSRIIKILKGVVADYGLDRNEGSEGETK